MATENTQLEIDNLKKAIQDIGNEKKFTLTDLNAFFKAVEPVFGITPKEGDNFLSGAFPPEVLSILEDITIAVPMFNPESAGAPSRIKILITCNNGTAPWAIIPDVFVIEQISLSVELIGQSFSAVLYGTIDIEGIPLMVEADFPSMFVKAEMVDDNPNAANILLNRFNAGPVSSGKMDGLILTQLFLLGDPRNKKAVMQLGIGGIGVGPGTLAVQGGLNYTGKPGSQISGSFWGDYRIEPKDCQAYDLILMAEFDGPGQGWKFRGGAGTDPADSKKRVAGISDLINVFDPDISNIPGFLKDLKVVNLDIAYETQNKNFSFTCDVEVDHLFSQGTDIKLIVSIALKRTNPDVAPTVAATYDKTFSGRLIIGLEDELKMEFDILFDLNQTAASTRTTFIADYKNLAGGDISIGALTSKLDPNLNFPLTINLKDAFLIYDKDGVNPANLLFGLDIGTGINLSNLPLVGQLFPGEQTLKLGFQPLIASGSPQAGPPIFAAAELARLQALVPGGGITLPDTDISALFGLGINLQMGDTVRRLELPVVVNKTKSAPVPQGTPPAKPTPIGEALESGTPAPANQPAPASPPVVSAKSSDGDIKWVEIQKSFGPVQFNRAGFAFAKSKIHAYLDASLGLAGLTLSLDGLGVSSPINKFDPSFSLMGLGLDFQQGPIEIGGSFLRTTVAAKGDQPAYDEYEGMAILKVEILNISAIGSYARVGGHHSLFIYAVLNYPIGGPSFFFVTGLAAGFGYNRALRVPDITQVATFPLVNEAVNGAGSGPPADNAGRQAYLQEEITKLRDNIYPKAGEYFLAAGIRFSSFEMIDSFVMVAIAFGQHFEIDVLGLSTMALPTPDPAAAKVVSPLIEVQMALKAVLNPDEGFLSVEAQLTNNSFLFDRACHLTGGFAFYVWFGGPHQGDFVITLGGYHPLFIVPSHYPTVPRLGFNWQVSTEFSIKGEAYFALTAHALMAGGKLEALFHSGSIKAWFIIGADFIISWKPYFYDARMYLSMGVSYTFWLFGTHTISVSIGADLHIWGPDFSGIAEVHLWIVSFTVKFGDAAPKPKPIDWNTFQHSFLPEPRKIVTISVSDGLIKQEPGMGAVVNPKDICLSVNTVVPVQSYALDIGVAAGQEDQLYFADPNQAIPLSISSHTPKNATAASTQSFGIAPMDIAAVTKSELKITIEDEGGKTVNQEFAFLPILKRMPRAMWGSTLTTEANSAQYIENALTGFELRPATPTIPSKSQPVLKQDLRYEIAEIPDGYVLANIKSLIPAKQTNDFKVSNTIMAATEKRNEMLRSLGFNLDALNIQIPPDIDTIFVATPQKGVPA